MRLRADAGEIDVVLADWWQEFSMADDDLRQDMVDQVREEQQQRQRAPRVHKAPVARDATSVPRDAAPAADADGARPDLRPAFAPGEPADSADAPKKRRRRRRTGGPRDGGEQTPDAGV
jgi:poly(A) polymerase